MCGMRSLLCSSAAGRETDKQTVELMDVVMNGMMAWHGMVEVREGAPVAVGGWVLADRHDPRPCAASSLHRGTTSVGNMMGGTGTLGMACALTSTGSRLVRGCKRQLRRRTELQTTRTDLN